MYAEARSFTNSLASSPPSAERISRTRFIECSLLKVLFIGPEGRDSNPTSSRLTGDNHLADGHLRDERVKTMF